MKRLNVLAVLLFLLSVLLGSCGHGDSSSVVPYPYYYPGYAGTFLSWTNSHDANHSFMLVRVDGKTGTVTNIGGNDYFPAMAYAPDGTLYGVSSELHIINTTDGSTAKIGSLDYGVAETAILMCGAAFSPVGVLYVVENSSPSRVFTVDLNTAALTYVGTPTALIWDLEFASSGTLYGAFGDLFVLDPDTMNTLFNVGDTGTAVSPLTFDSGGRLFGMDIFPSTRIFSLSLSNGWAAPIIQTGSKGLNSLVVERPLAKPAGVLFKAEAKNDVSAQKSLETLLSMEKEIKSARRMK